MARGHKKAVLLLLTMIITGVVFTLTPLSVWAQGGPAIEITAPSAIVDWALSPQGEQPKTQSGMLTVTTTNADGRAWSVAATDEDKTNTNGHMTKYRSSAYVTDTTLGTAMQVQGSAGTVTLPAGGDVVTGSGTVTGAEYTITFRQTALWTDAVVTSPDSYRIIVTFTASIAL